MRLRLVPCKPRRGTRATRGVGVALPGRTWPALGPKPLGKAGALGRGPGETSLLHARQYDRRGVGGELEMPQDAANDGSVGDSGDDPQGTPVTSGASFQVDGKDPLEQPRPAKARGSRARLRLDTLLARGGGIAPRHLRCAAKQPATAPAAPVAGRPMPPASLTVPMERV
jgi:hypothetical protein